MPFIDLDDFKKINDQWGHAVGDKLLTTVAGRLLRSVRTSDSVARIGGDEFVMLLENVETESELNTAMERVRSELS